MDEFTVADIDADMVQTRVDLEEDQVPLDQILLGDARAFVDLGAGIAGQFDADGIAEHFTGEGGAIDASLAVASHAVRNATPLFVYGQDFVDIRGG